MHKTKSQLKWFLFLKWHSLERGKHGKSPAIHFYDLFLPWKAILPLKTILRWKSMRQTDGRLELYLTFAASNDCTVRGFCFIDNTNKIRFFQMTLYHVLAKYVANILKSVDIFLCFFLCGQI